MTGGGDHGIGDEFEGRHGRGAWFTYHCLLGLPGVRGNVSRCRAHPACRCGPAMPVAHSIGMSSEPTPVRWLDEPQKHDYPAAADYLQLLADPETVDSLVEGLRVAPVVHKKAKDILRAARLELVPPDNPHVRADLAKILTGKPLSPILLVQGDLTTGTPMQIADGYHRMCACYHTDENIPIPAKLVSMPVARSKITGADKKSKPKK